MTNFETMEEVVRQHYTDSEKREIFDREFLHHITAMYIFGYRLTLDQADAKDLVQATYFTAFRFI